MSRAFSAAHFKRSHREYGWLLACLEEDRRGECTCIDPRNLSAGLLRTHARLSSLRLCSFLENQSATAFCMVLTIGMHRTRVATVRPGSLRLPCLKNGSSGQEPEGVSHVAARPMRTTPEGFRRKADGVQVTCEPSSSPSHKQRDPPFRGCPDCVQCARIFVRAAPFTSRPAG
jgi:hypothetical protein